MKKFHIDGSSPDKGDVFVFGSNLAGRHGKGAALFARNYCGAVTGVGEGFMDQEAACSCYAVPTKGHNLEVLPILTIRRNIKRLIKFVRENPDRDFFITRVACDLAGYADDEIAPSFLPLVSLPNCSFPRDWKLYLKRT